MRPRPTIKDIARDLGVSYATVSLALNDAPVVKEETRLRIKEHARKVRYRPNASARAITTGRTHLIAFVVSRLTISFFLEILQGVENVANEYGFDVIVHTVQDPTICEPEYVERLLGRNVDGMIAASFALSDAALQRLEETGLPVLLLGPTHPTGMHVLVDDTLGGRLAMEHLVDLGHHRVLFVGGHSPYSQARRQGALERLAECGGTLEWCPTSRGQDPEGARAVVAERLAKGHDFTAVFCADDVLAAGVCQELQSQGLSIPEDISVVGYDDLSWACLFHPSLTTIRQPQVSQGETAMRMLVEAIEGCQVENRTLPPRLIVRELTGPVRE